jgi:hypothetical protein
MTVHSHKEKETISWIGVEEGYGRKQSKCPQVITPSYLDGMTKENFI